MTPLRFRPKPDDKGRSKRVHLLLTIVWWLLLPPTLIWWRESIVWLCIMSWYANMVGHWSALEAAKE